MVKKAQLTVESQTFVSLITCPLRTGLGKVHYQVNQKSSVGRSHCMHEGSWGKVGKPTEFFHTMLGKLIQELFDANYESKPSRYRHNPEWVGCVFMQLETSEICLLGQPLCFCCHLNYSSGILCYVYWTVFILWLLIVLFWRSVLSFHTGICEHLSTLGLTLPWCLLRSRRMLILFKISIL